MTKSYTAKGIKYTLTRDENKGHTNIKVLQIENANKNKTMSRNSINTVLDILKKSNKDSYITVLGFGPSGWSTIKTDQQKSISWEAIDKYIEDRVENSNKFKTQYGIQVYISKDI